MEWARICIKVDFSWVIFTDEYRATVDGPDNRARGWFSADNLTPLPPNFPRGREMWDHVLDGNRRWHLNWKNILHSRRGKDRCKDFKCFPWQAFLAMLEEAAAKTAEDTTIYARQSTSSCCQIHDWLPLKKVGVRDDNVMIWPPPTPFKMQNI